MKVRLSATALQNTISPAKHVDAHGSRVEWHEVFGCDPCMYFDEVRFSGYSVLSE